MSCQNHWHSLNITCGVFTLVRNLAVSSSSLFSPFSSGVGKKIWRPKVRNNSQVEIKTVKFMKEREKKSDEKAIVYHAPQARPVPRRVWAMTTLDKIHPKLMLLSIALHSSEYPFCQFGSAIPASSCPFQNSCPLPAYSLRGCSEKLRERFILV